MIGSGKETVSSMLGVGKPGRCQLLLAGDMGLMAELREFGRMCEMRNLRVNMSKS